MSAYEFEVRNAAGSRRLAIKAPYCARALRELVTVGANGITQQDVSWWTTRLASAVHELRHRYNLDIITLYEKHDTSVHARYVLRDKVRELSQVRTISVLAA